MIYSNQLLEELSIAAVSKAGRDINQLERACWMVVHKYRHGVMPSEYDIREIDEDLYLKVLEMSKSKMQ